MFTRRLLAFVVVASAVWPLAATAGPEGPSGLRGVWLSSTVAAPVTVHIDLLQLTLEDSSRRYELTYPALTLGVDIRRPSSRGASLSLSFLQAPLLHWAVASTRGKLNPLLLTLVWISGGSFRWSPGGVGNVYSSEGRALTAALVLRNDLGLPPFVRPIYVRDTLGAGLAMTVDKWLGPETPYPIFTCGGGVLGSAARDSRGQTAFHPGFWVTCSLAMILR